MDHVLFPIRNSRRLRVNEMRSYLHELKAYNIVLFQEKTAGHSFISHVIFNKLPVTLRRELMHRTSNNYPSLNEIFFHYNEAIKTISKTTFVKKKSVNKLPSKPSTVTSNSSSSNSSSSNSSKSSIKGESKSTMQNFKSVNTVAFGLYNIYLQNKAKNETVKEGGLVLKIMHDSCETNLPEKMAAGLRSLLITFSKKSMLFQDFFVHLEGRKSLET